jgi:hypothetical protein
VAIDTWTGPSGVVDGRVFRPVNRADSVQGEVLSEKVVWQMLRPYAAAAGAFASPAQEAFTMATPCTDPVKVTEA